MAFLSGCDFDPSKIVLHPSSVDTFPDSISVYVPIDSISSPDSSSFVSLEEEDVIVRYSSANMLAVSKAILVHDGDLELIEQYHLPSDLNGYDYQIVSLSDEYLASIDSTTLFASLAGADSVISVPADIFLDSLRNRPDLGLYARCWCGRKVNDSIPTIRMIVIHSVNPY